MNLDKKTFLQQGSALYSAMIELAGHDVIRRYLATRIVVNAMAFEDLIHNRREQQLRDTRNVLLAHKQESDFFESYGAIEDIKRAVIDPLLQLMQTETGTLDPRWTIGELQPGASKEKLQALLPLVFEKYEKDFIVGNRISVNALGSTDSTIHEISKNDLAGVFYRYHGAKAIFDLAQYIFNNVHSDPDLPWVARHAKLDLLLSAQNMADSVIRDQQNPRSINGLLEIMTQTPIGDPSALRTLSIDSTYLGIYQQVRRMRNKLIAHMDTNIPLGDLVTELDQLPDGIAYDMVNLVDKSVHSAARSHIAVWTRYALGNQPINDPSITEVNARSPTAY